MSGVGIVWHLLTNDSAVTALVRAERIQAGEVEQGTQLPAISVQKVSANPHNTVAMDDSEFLFDERVQVSVFAKDYEKMDDIRIAVRKALPLSRGTVGSYTCEAIIPDLEGPDDEDPETKIHSSTLDFMVSYNRTVS